MASHGGAAANPLISSQSNSELQVILHPLVLLAVSDYITRHTLRNQSGPIVGALLGQQNGREITIEHAFDCKMNEVPADGTYGLDLAAFTMRVEQMRAVHKDRSLDFVGWYTLLPSSGPTEAILDVHRTFLTNYNESAILLVFHPDEVLNHSAGGKLPLTIYESNWEVEDTKPDAAAAADSEDKKMDDATAGAGALQLRFRELTYSVETDETEMIGMNYVAGGAGGAEKAPAPSKDEKPARSIESNGKGKRRLVESEADDKAAAADRQDADELALTREEEETIASLTTKANAIKMLQSRIQLITAYLQSLPPLNSAGEADVSMDADVPSPSLPVLRQIQAVVSRLDLVVPSDKETFDRELLQETNDVHLLDLLNAVMQSTSQVREVGKKHGIVESAKSNTRRGGIGEFSAPGAINLLNSDMYS